MPLTSHNIRSDEVEFKTISEQKEFYNLRKIGDFIEERYFFKAMNKLNLHFNWLKNGFKSKREFIVSIGEISILFDKIKHLQAIE